MKKESKPRFPARQEDSRHPDSFTSITGANRHYHRSAWCGGRTDSQVTRSAS